MQTPRLFQTDDPIHDDPAEQGKHGEQDVPPRVVTPDTRNKYPQPDDDDGDELVGSRR